MVLLLLKIKNRLRLKPVGFRAAKLFAYCEASNHVEAQPFEAEDNNNDE